MKKTGSGLLLLPLLLATLFWALGHPLGRILLERVHPFQLGTMTLAIGFLCVFLYLVARRVQAAGVRLVEYTDVARDGMFTGVDADGAARLAREVGVEVVASGGVASLEDIRACRAAGLFGVIVGKAIYEKRIDLVEAIRLTKEH